MITQKKIAETLGVAQRTVANILGGKPGYRYSQATRDRVLKAAQEAGYQTNRTSRAVRLGRSNLIGIIHFGSSVEVARKADACLPQIINAEGYDYLVIDLNWHGGNIERVINELIQVRVEGVIISHMTEAFGAQYTEMLTKVGIPSVVVYGDDRLNNPLICDDIRSAFFAMTKHVLSVGHRRLMLMVNSYEARPALERIDGFQLAMKDHGGATVLDDATFFNGPASKKGWKKGGLVVRVDLFKFGHQAMTGFYETAKRLLSTGVLPDAILCFNDMAAFAVSVAALERGLRVPDDLAVTGSDNDLVGDFSLFSLTTIEKDIGQTCAAAVQILVNRIQTGKWGNRERIYPSTLILRRSCGRKIDSGEESVRRVPVDKNLKTSVQNSLQ